MIEAYPMAYLTGAPKIRKLALYLAQSDHLRVLQWFGCPGPEAEVSAHFTPSEWWSLGPERIVWEVQQALKNFAAALEPCGA